jgi:prevent-host-death family protein
MTLKEDGAMIQTTVGIRELKARLSAYIKQVKAGATLVITERGQPVGRIVPLSPSAEIRAQELVQAGLIAWSGHKLAPLAPVARTRDRQTVADLLLEDRE